MRSHVAMLCETAPSSQNSAVCLHSIGLVFRFTHATTPLHMYVPHPILRWLNYRVLMLITVANYTVLSLIQSPDSLDLLGYACMRAQRANRSAECASSATQCIIHATRLWWLWSCRIGLLEDVTEDEIKEQEKLMIAVRAHTLFGPAWSEQRLNAFCNRLTTASQYIHPQNPDSVVPMEPKLVVP